MLKLSVAALALISTSALAAPEIGAPAPAFEGAAASGETVKLSDYLGQKVVLEWTNNGCPFVQKHYNSGNMQATQEAAKADGAVWISVISSAPGMQGHVSADEANALSESRGASPDEVVLDPSGEIGRLYAAKTTPHMFIIDEEGVLRYDGAIDDRPSADPSTIEGAKNYVLAVLGDMDAGRPVESPATKPYGCSVKYAH